MKKGALIYAVGLVTGALVMSATHSVWHQPERAAQTNPGQETAQHGVNPVTQEGANAPAPDVAAETSTAASPDTSPEASSGRSGASTQPVAVGLMRPAEVEMPDIYAEMIEPQPLPKTLAPPELFEKFTDDLRDEAWAYPMELGINQYIARRGGELEAVLEFVECRSRYCTIAGIVYDGGQATVNVMLSEMTQSGWWQTFGGASTVGRTTDTEYRFVSIFPRAREDTDRDPAIDEIEQKAAESTGQAVDT